MTGQPGTYPHKEKRRPLQKPARVFISYAQEDADLRAELDKHLAGLRKSGHVLVWHDRMIRPGDDRAGVIDAELEAADIVLLLVSASFFASSSCFDIELAKALERHQRGQTHVIPVLVSDCDWTDAPFGHLQAVPHQPGAGAKPVTAWTDRNAAWASVARELRTLLEGGTDAPSGLPPQSESDTGAPVKPRSYAVAGVLVAGIAAAGIAVAVAVHGMNEDPSDPAPKPPDSVSRPRDNAPRLIRVGTKLYVTNAPAGVQRDNLLYARAPNPLPNSKEHPKIGILRGVDREGDTLLVAWFTLLDEDVDAALRGEGLPVDLIGQDIQARIGRHWGEYVGQPSGTFPKAGNDIVLEIAMGHNDGVQPGDQYEVLGEPKADRLNRTVDSFEGLGTCTVLPFGADATRSRCQLDRGAEAPRFGEQHWVRGGYVRAITPRSGP